MAFEADELRQTKNSLGQQRRLVRKALIESSMSMGRPVVLAVLLANALLAEEDWDRADRAWNTYLSKTDGQQAGGLDEVELGLVEIGDLTKAEAEWLIELVGAAKDSLIHWSGQFGLPPANSRQPFELQPTLLCLATAFDRSAGDNQTEGQPLRLWQCYYVLTQTIASHQLEDSQNLAPVGWGQLVLSRLLDDLRHFMDDRGWRQ